MLLNIIILTSRLSKPLDMRLVGVDNFHIMFHKDPSKHLVKAQLLQRSPRLRHIFYCHITLLPPPLPQNYGLHNKVFRGSAMLTENILLSSLGDFLEHINPSSQCHTEHLII